MDLKTFLDDPRRRNLAILAALAVAGMLLAVLALNQRAEQVAPKYPPHVFLNGLAAKVTQTARIHIVSKKYGAFDVAFVPMKGWVLPGRANYSASFEEVKRTLVGLAALVTIEPKTARPDWFHYVALDAPPKGDGTAITLGDAKGRVLASLIVGKTEDIGDPSGAVGLFVRKPGDGQSWLVESVFEPRANPADWMDKQVMDVDRARIQEVDVRPATGPAYSVSRAKPSDADFALAPIPRGREVSDPSAPDGVASSVVGFSFDDVQPAGGFDFANGATRIVTHTFDGLIVTVDVIKQGSDYWAQVFADAAPGKTAAAKEANEINAHAARWAYKLAAYKGAQLSTPLEGLLKPKK
jgi:hypothetical protein